MTYKDLNSLLQYPMSPELVDMLDDGGPLTLKKYEAVNAHFEERDRPWKEAAKTWFATQPTADIPLKADEAVRLLQLAERRNELMRGLLGSIDSMIEVQFGVTPDGETAVVHNYSAVMDLLADYNPV
jgi:hypothetical protein